MAKAHPSSARTCSISVTRPATERVADAFSPGAAGGRPCARAQLRSWCALLPLWLALALLGSPGHAAAQSKDPAAAEALFREGRALSDAGDIAGACAKFRESERLDPAIGTTFNIADCEERLGHLARAWTLFDEVAQRLPPSDKRRPVAQQRAAALEPRLPKLSIRLAANAPRDARVVRDGVELGAASLGTALPVDPGRHVVVVSAKGHADRSFSLIVSERELRALDVDVGPPIASGPEAHVAAERVASPSRGSGSRAFGYVLGGVGVAGFVTSAIAGVMLLQKKGVVDDHCDAAKRCDSQGLAATESGKTLGIVTTAGLITGAVGVGAGAYLIVSAGSPDRAAAASVGLGGSF